MVPGGLTAHYRNSAARRVARLSIMARDADHIRRRRRDRRHSLHWGQRTTLPGKLPFSTW